VLVGAIGTAIAGILVLPATAWLVLAGLISFVAIVVVVVWACA